MSCEDGFCDFVKVSSEDIYCTGAKELFPSHSGKNVEGGDYGGCSIGLAVANMSTLHYTLGEG